MLLIVDASILRQKNELSKIEGKEVDDVGNGGNTSDRISRHELYSDIFPKTDISSTYLIMVILSAIIAAIGLVRNDMAIIIGAMVLAPLLIPNVALGSGKYSR